ncbi:NADPH:quinone reductase [Microbispora hainanensis]|uniref:NADPH:quinone reductase n=1 Tax=Microbispora hainanensis TaxID=568844 RepID=A0A544YRW9_9ACTN|nr:NADPH:quinone reductase [Microbispora hainanensis]TQS19515.1 NADPH:quinone reductase [Microbispora hainanensis]
MRAIVYSETGDSDVLRLTERPVPEPGPGEVRVRVVRSGVNPTDWKARRGTLSHPEAVPDQDGAGIVDATGPGVTGVAPGDRVWVWEAAWGRPDGTAQEYVVLPERQVVPLPDGASLDLGASLGIPALTAHRCLTVADGGPDRLAPGALDGRTVLVAGGAGAVGNAAIQLARWAGATVVTTVSGPEKAALARAAGAHHVVDYRVGDPAAEIRRVAPGGADIVVEVAPAPNAALDAAVTAPGGVVAVYANNGGDAVTLSVRDLFTRNIRYQFVLVYTVPEAVKDAAVADVRAAVEAGALRVGEEAGLPLHHFPLERTADAHDAVESGAVGKVLVDVAPD